MLTDTWIIAQLLAQTSSLLLLLVLIPTVFRLLKKWNILEHTELQIELERRTFLVGAVIELVLLFQSLALVAFLVTLNEHIPSLLKGAMCATGALSANDWGYPLLYLKIGSLFLYFIFLFVHFLDKNEPYYPLTPYKYWLVLPAFVALGAELVMMIFYFNALNPDLIATCCSVSFFAAEVDTQSFLTSGKYINEAFYLWASFGAVIGMPFLLKDKLKFSFWISILSFVVCSLYVGLSIYVLKFFFVKYIYGLPSHLCLFDIFFQKYYYIGYLISFNLIFLVIYFLNALLFSALKKKLSIPYNQFWKNYTRIAAFVWVLSWLVPVAYYVMWDGVL